MLKEIIWARVKSKFYFTLEEHKNSMNIFSTLIWIFFFFIPFTGHLIVILIHRCNASLFINYTTLDTLFLFHIFFCQSNFPASTDIAQADINIHNYIINLQFNFYKNWIVKILISFFICALYKKDATLWIIYLVKGWTKY